MQELVSKVEIMMIRVTLEYELAGFLSKPLESNAWRFHRDIAMNMGWFVLSCELFLFALFDFENRLILVLFGFLVLA